ncbi:MAG: ATP-binding protein [Chloroflexales bacterium]|nr:ATP-binding protein [Chloroflexales bacterium]
MHARLGKRLAAARQRHFVGRSAELELFRMALGRDDPDVAVLHIHGPGGMGKTSLLREFAQIAEEAGRSHVPLDGRNLDPSPAGFMAALHKALSLAPDAAPLDALAATPDLVLFLDTYELVAPLDVWLRDSFLPQLPEGTLVVVAGRQPPASAWRAEDGWGALTRIISLRNLRPDESAVYLRDRGLSAQEAAQVLDVTYGHPLALSLAADLLAQHRAAGAIDLRRDPDILHLLLERFAAEVPDATLRQALEICAHAFGTDEALLARCLGKEQAHAAFQWLRGLSFIEQGPHGLFPHDLAREVLEADLRWRDQTRFDQLHDQVRTCIIQRVVESSGWAQQTAIFALLFLHRNNPFMRPFYAWQTFGQLYIDRATPADLALIEQLILRHQGPESLAVARHWLPRSQSAFYVFRAAGGVLAGFCQVLDISQLDADDLAADPAMPAAVACLQPAAPPRQGERILYFRNWMDVEGSQRSPSIFNMCAMISIRSFFTTPRLAYSFIAQEFSDEYAEMFAYLRMPLAPAAGFAIDGRTFGAFAHDWRAEPVLEWLRVMGERELLDEVVALEALPHPQQPVALSEPEFAEAVRQALKQAGRPDLLAQSPLLRSRCLRDRSEQEPTPALLQAALREGADTITASPRTQKLHRVLWHTYFEPAPTQEAAAELLGLPFSTYRHQLGRAVEQLVAWLWQQELYGVTRELSSGAADSPPKFDTN